MSHLGRLLTDLAKPANLPGAPASVEVIQTHASAVFLTPTHVYKVKKPLDLGFLDYSTLAKREACCQQEVRLNQRLAPHVYLGVLPITEGPDGLRIGGDGPAVEWAVHMTRLPDGNTLRDRLRSGTLPDHIVHATGERVAHFHATAEPGDPVHTSFDVVAKNARDNVRTCRELGVFPHLVDRLDAATESALQQHEHTLRGRAHRSIAIHGDLRLEHVYWLPDEPEPHDLVIIDCIEFNDAFRFADPVADIGFLSMDLRAYGAWQLASQLEQAWTTASGDTEGAALFPFYVAYRSAVRAKVAALTASESEVPQAARDAASARLLRHLLLALATLEPRGPELIAVGGLPGTGKTTVARFVADALHATHIRSDVVRKTLAGLTPETSAAAAPDAGLYTPAHTERTYAAVLDQAREALTQGKPVVLDATWSTRTRREQLRTLATELGVRFTFFQCTLPDPEVEARISARRGDASDADFGIYLHAKARWEEADDAVVISTVGTVDEVRERVRGVLGLGEVEGASIVEDPACASS